MTGGAKRNLPASVLARLLTRARGAGDGYQALVTVYVSERFLFRLGVSPVRDRFILKGAMLFRVWSGQAYRMTRDLDLLHRGEDSRDAIRRDVEAVLAAEVEPDGLEFDASSLRIEDIRPEDEYAGVRITMRVRCGSFRTSFQVDVGIGDAVWPPPAAGRMTCLLEMPEPDVLTYSPDSVIAEKLEAIRRTFVRRRTPVPKEVPFGLTEAYWETPGRPTQLRAFAKRSGLEVDSESVKEIPTVLRAFLLPILEDVRSDRRTVGSWAPPGPWR